MLKIVPCTKNEMRPRGETQIWEIAAGQIKDVQAFSRFKWLLISFRSKRFASHSPPIQSFSCS